MRTADCFRKEAESKFLTVCRHTVSVTIQLLLFHKNSHKAVCKQLSVAVAKGSVITNRDGQPDLARGKQIADP